MSRVKNTVGQTQAAWARNPRWAVRAGNFVLTTVAFASSIAACDLGTTTVSPESAPGRPVRLAVLGDSDSHSYQDTVSFKPGSAERGGALRAVTFQWTEILAQLRSREIAQGEWGTWGYPGKVARVGESVGLALRSPRKQDYRFNFAVSGASCADLMTGAWRQAPRLAAQLDEDAQQWRQGVAVIRIGINSLGRAQHLDRFSETGVDEDARLRVGECIGYIEKAVELIRRHQPGLRIVLVGILNNADWPPNFGRWHSREEIARIEAVCDLFDDQLRAIARARPGVAFFDDRAWFRHYWGARGADGRPAYRVASLPGGLVVSNTQGDTLEHAVVADGHGGTASNALWARDLITFLNREFDMRLTPISDSELSHFLRNLQSKDR